MIKNNVKRLFSFRTQYVAELSEVQRYKDNGAKIINSSMKGLSPANFNEVMGKMGIKKNDTIIFYGEKRFRSAWLARFLGATNVKVFNGLASLEDSKNDPCEANFEIEDESILIQEEEGLHKHILFNYHKLDFAS